jgi:hypothetical protein
LEENGDLENYRQLLEQRYSEVSGAYDKAIMTLSGGGLGISIAFFKDISPNPVESTVTYILIGWIALTFSILAVLLALLFGQRALREAIDQVDKGTIFHQNPGGRFTYITGFLNILSGVLFVVGIFLILIFVVKNV